MADLVRTMHWPGGDIAEKELLLTREWLITNGLGGYASGTVSGVLTRRFHGLLVAALPAPYGRRMMVNDLSDQIVFPGGKIAALGGEEKVNREPEVPGASYLREFRLEYGVPTWIYKVDDVTLEKRLLMIHKQNTVHINYRLYGDDCDVRLELRPALNFRPHEGAVGMQLDEPYVVNIVDSRFAFSSGDADTPALRALIHGRDAAFTYQPHYVQ
ncbi:MAG: glycogen debranching enzyme N-terminal domain-containing protein, partial [Bryobacteraceae bacterium]